MWCSDRNYVKEMHPMYKKFAERSSFSVRKRKKQILDFKYDYTKIEGLELSSTNIMKEEPNQRNIWVHMCCVLSTPELFLKDPEMDQIRGFHDINRERFHLTCELCQLSGYGVHIQCSTVRCMAAFHPECARRANLHLYMNIENRKQVLKLHC